MIRRPGAAAALVLLAAVLSGCGAAGPTETIGMVNATTIPVAVHVNGTWVGTFPAWSEHREIVIGGHGGPPWKVEFFGPDGEVMGDLDISTNVTGDSGNGTGWSSSCGQFAAWFRTVPNDIPPLDPGKMRPASPPCT